MFLKPEKLAQYEMERGYLKWKFEGKMGIVSKSVTAPSPLFSILLHSELWLDWGKQQLLLPLASAGKSRQKEVALAKSQYLEGDPLFRKQTDGLGVMEHPHTPL